MEQRSATEPATDGHTWAIVLAAGNGTRLSSLTRDSDGAAVPKQFCSLDGSSSLLEQTVDRAAHVVSPRRVTAIVAASHRRYWEPTLKGLPPENIVVQPHDRGTAIGILLPALRIVARDPNARILILPSDHYVADEAVLANTMRCALEEVGEHPAGVALLGIEAEDADPELGYIVSRATGHPRLRNVERFVEKPPAAAARRLVSEGALWNSFIIACHAQRLIELLQHGCPYAVRALRDVNPQDDSALVRLYRELPVIDFSRHIATGRENRLAVMAVPHCGWNDLGTPDRLAQTLVRHRSRNANRSAATPRKIARWINLTDRLTKAHPDLRLDVCGGDSSIA